MEDFIVKYYKGIKELLQQGSLEEVDKEELALEANKLNNKYFNEWEKRISSEVFEFEGEQTLNGLFKKFDRLYGNDTNFIVRNAESNLAQKLDWGVGIDVPSCPYFEDALPDIQKKITNFISQRVRTAEDEMSTPLLTGEASTELYQEQLNYIVNYLIEISHSIKDYVDYYDNGTWNWQIDCVFIMQYVFEKAAEITYMVAKEQSTEGISYDIREAFTYFHTDVPEEFQDLIDGCVDKLENIVLDITSYIEKYDYHTCSKETWFRPIVFNIALEGMLFTLEQDI